MISCESSYSPRLHQIPSGRCRGRGIILSLGHSLQRMYCEVDVVIFAVEGVVVVVDIPRVLFPASCILGRTSKRSHRSSAWCCVERTWLKLPMRNHGIPGVSRSVSSRVYTKLIVVADYWFNPQLLQRNPPESSKESGPYRCLRQSYSPIVLYIRCCRM